MCLRCAHRRAQYSQSETGLEFFVQLRREDRITVMNQELVQTVIRKVCSAKTSAGIMRRSFPMNIRDADHTKYPSLESDNQVVTCACASVELAVVWQRSPQAFQDPKLECGRPLL